MKTSFMMMTGIRLCDSSCLKAHRQTHYSMTLQSDISLNVCQAPTDGDGKLLLD